MLVTDQSPPSILDIIDSAVAERTAKRDDPVGQLVMCVLRAAAPDAVLADLVRQMLTGFQWETRKAKITMLSKAFGADRKEFKKYLRAHTLCGPAD